MKAIIWAKYGSPDVLQLRDVKKPTPKDNEVLIKIIATTVTAGDCETRSLNFPIILSLALRMWIGFRKPKENTIPGTELAGEIEAIGKDVTNFKVGDPVFGASGMAFGTNAEYICLPEEPDEMQRGIAIKPANMTFEEAATVPFGGRDALHFLRLAKLQGGEKMLINGAGGSIGVFAVQLAKYFGAEVTAVDSGEKLAMLREIGADHMIDYTKEDFTKSNEVYDIIFDIIGKISFSRSNIVLKKNGTYLLANPMSQIISGLWTRMTSGRKVIMQTASGTIEDLVFLRELIEAGKLKTVIDRHYPLEEIVEAHRYVETGRKKGNLVITI
ncbi:MAG: NAD(P)-dependent alcohol dehydrogenase [Anaerolineae bacterium]|jgi:NADPH:quinone reductase-like Zn-dependent oxidoreductase|nr:NAD(P)-dependent alcohol dehydrogenase [Anaerolineae bacterium]MBT7070242.1 NAD(P)-dependent alcohol dehydrogenase [Anaerolineae bacterium]MBT7325314.1 NAD(P)-dependent alcohol dehydrogenase [Anaerolineae bacterium]